MSIEYRDNGRAILAYQEDRHVATIVRQGDKFGYSVFNTPHMGAVSTEDEAKQTIERFID